MKKAHYKNPSDIKVDIVIPVLNEAHVLEKSVNIVRDFLKRNLAYHWKIVIVDNGSTDDTLNIARMLADKLSEVKSVYLNKKGRGRALRETWQNSKSDVVLYTDVDLSTELDALPKLVNALVLEGYDIAIGSRLSKGSRTYRCFKREFTSQIYNLLIKCMLFVKFTDAQCGFKAVTREVVDNIVPQVKDQEWFFDTELLVLAEKQGYKIKDIPVTWIEDDDSRVKLIHASFSMFKGLCRLRWLLVKRRFLKINSCKEKPPLKETAN